MTTGTVELCSNSVISVCETLEDGTGSNMSPLVSGPFSSLYELEFDYEPLWLFPVT